MADAELIVVFIDNSFAAYESIRDQYAAVEHYCETKLAANPETEVTVFTMGSADFRCVLYPPTGSCIEVSDSLNGFSHKETLHSICIGGSLCLLDAIYFAFSFFCGDLGNMKKRMLFLVGGLVNMSQEDAELYGSILKKSDIVVDVVNFYLGKTPQDTSINQYGRMELDAFVNAAKSDDNSHIEHVRPRSHVVNFYLGKTPQDASQYGRMVLDAFVNAAKSDDNSHIEHVQPGSNIREVLSKFIFKKTLHDSMIKTNRREKAKRKNHSPLSGKTKRHKRAKGKNHADGDNEHGQTEALSISSGQGEANSAV